MAYVTDDERARADEVDRVAAMLARPGDDKPPTRSARNVMTILDEDSWFASRLWLDEFAGALMWDGHAATDVDVTGVRLAIADTYGMEPSATLTHECMAASAATRGRHPVREYLGGLLWDGVPRMHRLLDFYAGATATPLHEQISRCFLVSAVARVMQPGCKVDTVLILQGAQGAGKSRFFRVLGGEWFSDTAIDIRSKDALLALRGRWVYELAELAATRPRDAETVKAFLSAQVDHYRPPYGRLVVEVPRQCVMVGTTNEAAFLADATGARRFWPVSVGDIQLERLALDRDQLWAEAVEAYEAGAQWWLDAADAGALREVHEVYQHGDPWEPVIERWLDDHRRGQSVTMTEVLTEALGVPYERQTKGAEMRLSGLLQHIGRTRQRRQVSGVRTWVWV